MTPHQYDGAATRGVGQWRRRDEAAATPMRGMEWIDDARVGAYRGNRGGGGGGRRRQATQGRGRRCGWRPGRRAAQNGAGARRGGGMERRRGAGHRAEAQRGEEPGGQRHWRCRGTRACGGRAAAARLARAWPGERVGRAEGSCRSLGGVGGCGRGPQGRKGCGEGWKCVGRTSDIDRMDETWSWQNHERQKHGRVRTLQPL
ncbi:hypothetical protein PVAP13_2NG087646 [Panicum virgatum]|uniref:Uncharacterized protein n=1 Tax=Panicum virgatum TaxID=38727 RepID=A0A8T0V6Q3_PANVG|nr:hypothetical protein PVAP13_2NG087646 [Panicum virgatum]